MMKRISLSLLCVFCVSVARAAVVDANIFYFTDGITADADTTHAATLYSFIIGFNLDKKGMYQVGWNYGSHSTETKNETDTVTYKSTQMGPAFIMYFDKNRAFRFSFSYNLETTGEYDNGTGTAEEWRGTALNADLGYQFRFEDVFSLGLRLNYSTTSYAESIVGNTKEDVSHKKNIIYPSVAFTLDL